MMSKVGGDSMSRAFAGLLCLMVVISCGPASERAGESGVEYALAIHGGAGVPRESLADEEQRAYLQSLEQALRIGERILAEGGTSLDAVEQVVRYLEDDPLFNAGRGAVFTRDGVNELDASIMDGKTLACGAVTGVRNVRNPVSLSRAVMRETRHVLLAGEGAESFAAAAGIERVDPRYFFTQSRWDRLQEHLDSGVAGGGGTVGAVALDRHGDLAAATSTGGLTGKMTGRVGDTPIPGAGTYADNRSCAVSGTGVGEEFMRHAVAHQVAERMRLGGQSLADAVAAVIDDELGEGDGGVIAVDREGRIAMAFNTPGMFRGALDSEGRFELGIWE
jgi:beta-aspartyl-peptidase (threonine type)